MFIKQHLLLVGEVACQQSLSTGGCFSWMGKPYIFHMPYLQRDNIHSFSSPLHLQMTILHYTHNNPVRLWYTYYTGTSQLALNTILLHWCMSCNTVTEMDCMGQQMSLPIDDSDMLWSMPANCNHYLYISDALLEEGIAPLEQMNVVLTSVLDLLKELIVHTCLKHAVINVIM